MLCCLPCDGFFQAQHHSALSSAHAVSLLPLPQDMAEATKAHLVALQEQSGKAGDLTFLEQIFNVLINVVESW